MELFLGVDGGQTSTRVVLGDSAGKIVAVTSGGPSNHTEEPGGPERLRQVVESTVAEALSSLRLASDSFSFAAACLGMTGEIEIKRRVIEQTVRASRLSVVHDSVNALAGGTGGRAGLIVIAGTGSVALGKDDQGREIRAGGWGHLFGDEGSAYWIGREAVRALLAEHEATGGQTILTPMLSSRFGFGSPYELMNRYYAGSLSRQHLAGLATYVDEASEAGDRVAEQILTHAGRDLAKMASAIIFLLFSRHDQLSEKPIVCYSGGAFRSRPVRQGFITAVHEKDPEVPISAARFPAVLGSLLLAYGSAGIKFPEEILAGWIEVVSRSPLLSHPY